MQKKGKDKKDKSCWLRAVYCTGYIDLCNRV